MNLKSKRFESLSLTRAMKNKLKVWGNMNSNVAMLNDENDTQVMFARIMKDQKYRTMNSSRI